MRDILTLIKEACTFDATRSCVTGVRSFSFEDVRVRASSSISFPTLIMNPFLLLAVFLCGVRCQDSTEPDYLDDGVDTPSGRILGLDTRFFGLRAKSYLGIPYGKPPLGDLRFRRPQPPPPRQGLLVADTTPPACVQYSEYNFPWYDNQNGKSEDCLYLNIWSPRIAPSERKLPVIFWIHGGGFTVGSNRIRAQNGLGLAMRGACIVVAPNYRLGAFGFLSSGSDDAPGNAGMHDLILALQWTRENIGAFGGDLDRLTLMGEDSGSVLVSLFLLSPQTQGMFTRAIMQSGSFLALPPDSKERNRALGQRLAEALGCTPGNRTLQEEPGSTVDCLREVKASSIARTLAAFNPTSTTSFLPEYGNDLFPGDPTGDLKTGRFSPVPLLIGTNRDEGSYLLTTRKAEIFGVFGRRKDAVLDMETGAAILREMFDDDDGVDPEAVVRQYLGEVEPDDAREIRRQVYTALGDHDITCPSVFFAEQYGRGNGTVQYYVFGQRPNASVWAPWMGAAHWDEVPFVMGRYLAPYNYDTFLKNYGPELGLSDAMTRIWGDFAMDGSGFEGWKNYSSTHHQYILLKYNVMRKMRGPGPHLDNCNFFRPYYSA